MTLYIVIPTRRGTATAAQILVSHMFGDAFSPYLIGALADSFKPLISPNATNTDSNSLRLMADRSLSYELTPEEYDLEFRALEYSLFSCCFFQVLRTVHCTVSNLIFQALGAFFFFVVSWYVMSDKQKAERQIACNADMLGGETGAGERDGATPILRPSVDT